MAKKRYISDSFWTDSYVEDLEPQEKLLFLYLLTNPLCNIAGIYEISLSRISYETGIEKKALIAYLEKFIGDKKVMRTGNWVVLCNFAKCQSINPKVKLGMQRIIDDLPIEVLGIKGFDSLSHFTLLYLTLPNLTLPSGREKNYTQKKSEIISNEEMDNYGKESFGEFVKLYFLEVNKLKTECGDENLFNEIIEELNIAIGCADPLTVKQKYSNHFYAFQKFLRTKKNSKSPAKKDFPLAEAEKQANYMYDQALKNKK